MVLVQVASSASELPELEAQVSKIAMGINSIYSTLTHSPLVLLCQDISYSQFLALLSVAEIFMATNLREGMNLTSHDFIHCQDGQLASQKHGSLILSEFTGSASIFHGHELLINPWDYKKCADAIHDALDMSSEQKERNWKFLMDRKAPHTAVAWYSSLQTALVEAHSMQQSRDTHIVTPLRIDALQEAYHTCQRRLFFIEDDTLSLFQNTIDLLQALSLDPKNTIYLTSNRSPDQVDETAHDLPANIGLIAENGCFMKPSPSAIWEALVDVESTSTWRTGVHKVMEYFQERTEGSSIEDRQCSLTFYYDYAFYPDIAAHKASELADQINGARGSEAIRIVRETAAVSVEPLAASKAKAASFILSRIPAGEAPDFIFAAGSSCGDESLFRWANQLMLFEQRSQQFLHGEELAEWNGENESKPIWARTVTTLATSKHVTEAKAVLPTGWTLLDVLRLLSVPRDAQVRERRKSF